MRLLRCYSRFYPVIPAKAGIQRVGKRRLRAPSPQISDLYSRERAMSTRPSRSQPSPPPEIRHEYQSAGPFFLYGIIGVGFEIRLSPPSFPRKRESRRLPPSSPPGIKHKSQPAHPLSLYGLTGERRAKFAIRNQVRIPTSGSLLPLWEKARMRVRRAQARLRRRDARAPGGASPSTDLSLAIFAWTPLETRLPQNPGLLQPARDALEYIATGLFGSVWKLGKRSEARYG